MYRRETDELHRQKYRLEQTEGRGGFSETVKWYREREDEDDLTNENIGRRNRRRCT